MPAATPRLWFSDCTLPHASAATAEEALRLLRDDVTVCVPSKELAVEILIELGMTAEEADWQVCS